MMGPAYEQLDPAGRAGMYLQAEQLISRQYDEHRLRVEFSLPAILDEMQWYQRRVHENGGQVPRSGRRQDAHAW